MNPYARPTPANTPNQQNNLRRHDGEMHHYGRDNRQHNNRDNGGRNCPNQWQKNQSNRGRAGRYPQSRQESFESGQQNKTTSNQAHFSQAPRNNSSNTNQYSVLYTHQKQKKKKQWKDGRLTLPTHGGRATLYDANPVAGGGGAPIDTVEISAAERNIIVSGGELESEKYLIQIEGPWLPTSINSALTSLTNTNQPVVSTGMKKLMSRKFQVPPQKIPNFAEQRRQKMEREGKRRRVLQPGELERQHGGGWNGLSNGYQGVGYGNNRTQAENGDGYNNTGYGGQGNRLDGNYSGMNHQYNSGGNSFQGNQSRNNSFAERGFENQSNEFIDTNNPNSSGSSHNGFQGNGSYKNNQGSGHNGFQANGGYINNQGSNNGFLDFDQINTNGRHGHNLNSHQGYRENSRFRDVSASAGSNNGPMGFVSNGLDARGFYEEEEEDDDQNAGGDWNGDHNNSQQQTGITSMDDRCGDLNRSNVAGVSKWSKGYDQTNSTGDLRHCPSKELNARTNETHDNDHKSEQCSLQTQYLSSQVSNEVDSHVNDELFALLGVSTSGGQGRASNMNQESLGDNRSECDARAHGGNDHYKTHSTQNEEDCPIPSKKIANSFLAGLIEAEDSLEKGKPLSDWNSRGHYFDNQQYDDTNDGGDSYDDRDYDLDGSGVKEEEENNETINSQNDVSCNTEPAMSGITGLTLPSAGESSSDEDEDSAFEE